MKGSRHLTNLFSAMSKHLFNTRYEGQNATIEAGFNAGLMGGFFLNVYETENGPMGGSIYSSLMERGGLLEEVQDVEAKLQQLGIEVVEPFYQALFDDEANRVGNVITQWEGEQATQVYPALMA